MNHEEIKKYVINTIRSGNKERIIKVLKRYYEYLNKPIEPTKVVEEAKKIFLNE